MAPPVGIYRNIYPPGSVVKYLKTADRGTVCFTLIVSKRVFMGISCFVAL